MQWNQELLKQPWVRERVAEDVLATNWLGYPPATEAEVSAAEARLGTQLPPSYRAFLMTSNGWRVFSPEIPRLWSTRELEWLAQRRPRAIAAWREGEAAYGELPPLSDEEYLVYGDEQDPANIRSEYLASALEISEQEPGGSALLLLNPQIKTAEGEWEAWLWADWLPGAHRYRSFLAMLQAQNQTLSS